MKQSVEGRVVAITGGSQGLATAQAYAEAGADVVIRARRAGQLDQAREEIKAAAKREVGLVSFAAPVFASGDVPVLAISVIGIEAGLSPHWDGPVPKELRAFAASFSAQIGGLA
jgi:NAD(P)-dependent dehydrogenase (short-subunit alcohol dehydrogenase family)